MFQSLNALHCYVLMFRNALVFFPTLINHIFFLLSYYGYFGHWGSSYPSQGFPMWKSWFVDHHICSVSLYNGKIYFCIGIFCCFLWKKGLVVEHPNFAHLKILCGNLNHSHFFTATYLASPLWIFKVLSPHHQIWSHISILFTEVSKMTTKKVRPIVVHSNVLLLHWCDITRFVVF